MRTIPALVLWLAWQATTLASEPIDLDKLTRQLKAHEGKSTVVSKDSRGIPTIGVGFNLQRKDAGMPANAEKAAAENLKKVKDVIHKTDLGLHLLSRAAWVGSVLKKSPELAEAAKAIDKVRSPAKELDEMLERVNKAVNPDAAKKETGKFFAKLKLVRLDAQAEELRKIGNLIQDMPIGLVSDAVDDKFKVTPNLLANKPKEAEKRFADLLAGMKTNFDYLKTQQARLEEIHKYCKAASQVLTKLNNGIEKAVRVGFFTKPLVEKYLDVENLSRAYNGLADVADRKAKAVKAAAQVQQRRHDNLKSTIKTVFGFDL